MIKPPAGKGGNINETYCIARSRLICLATGPRAGGKGGVCGPGPRPPARPPPPVGALFARQILVGFVFFDQAVPLGQSRLKLYLARYAAAAPFPARGSFTGICGRAGRKFFYCPEFNRKPGPRRAPPGRPVFWCCRVAKTHY